MPDQSAVGAEDNALGLLEDVVRKLRTDTSGKYRQAIAGALKDSTNTRRILAKHLREPIYKDELERWKDRWRQSFSGLWVPEYREGFDRLIVIPRGIWNDSACALYSQAGIPLSFDKRIVDASSNDRKTDRAYAVWVRKRREADEENAKKSFQDLVRVSGISLLERLVFGWDWFLEFSDHPDQESWTLCTGSRCSNGDVPGMCSRGVGIAVHWDEVDTADAGLRMREVVC
ncbi:MAG: hypothetical protein Q7R63_01050 [bacterium]|nr:hypothetical protein [bacterium]